MSEQTEFEPSVPNIFELPTTHELIRHMAFEMKFLGIYYIITGALTSLTILGAIIGIPILISGLRLVDSAKKFLSFRYTLSSEDLLQALVFQRTYFRINFWIVVVGIILFVMYIITLIAFYQYFFGALQDVSPIFS